MARLMKSLFDIDFDIDAYLADGGRLLDLAFPSPREKQLVEGWLNSQGPEARGRVGRVGEFLTRIGSTRRPDSAASVGAHLTEEELRAIWQQTLE